MAKKNNNDLNKVFYYMSLVSQIGFIMIANIFVSMGIYWLISQTGVKNTLLFIFFIVLGIYSGFYSVFKILMNQMKK